MSQDGKDPPTPEPGERGGQRPALRVIMGGGGKPSVPPDPPALVQSSVSDEARARLVRAVRCLGAERAFLFVWDEEQFTLSEACATDPNGRVPEDRSVMWSLLDRITSRRVPLVLAGTDEQPSDALLSGVTAPLRMGVAVPLVSGNLLKGVVCLDKRIHKGHFATTDARAAAVLLHVLGVEAAQLPAMREGTPLADALDTAQLAAAAREALDESSGFSLHAQLAPAQADEIAFAAGRPTLDGKQRTVFCRLVLRPGTTDLLVHHLLACMRSFTFLAEGNLPDQLEGLSFELERGGREPFELHVTALEQRPGSRKLSTWQAGSGALVVVDATGSVTVPGAQSAPLTRAQRKLVAREYTISAGEQLLSLHGARLYDARGMLAVAPELQHALRERALPDAFVRVFQRQRDQGVSSWLLRP